MFLTIGVAALFFFGGWLLWALCKPELPILKETGRILFMAGAFALAINSANVATAFGFHVVR